MQLISVFGSYTPTTDLLRPKSWKSSTVKWHRLEVALMRLIIRKIIQHILDGRRINFAELMKMKHSNGPVIVRSVLVPSKNWKSLKVWNCLFLIFKVGFKLSIFQFISSLASVEMVVRERRIGWIRSALLNQESWSLPNKRPAPVSIRSTFRSIRRTFSWLFR